jgi:hypothetical protein
MKAFFLTALKTIKNDSSKNAIISFHLIDFDFDGVITDTQGYVFQNGFEEDRFILK